MTIPFSLVFLAGGSGSRMNAPIPKQYLKIQGKPLALYSFEVFVNMPEVQEVVVVCEPEYQSLFLVYAHQIKLRFASPGKRRQDSVFNGIQELTGNPLVCIHDAARPLITDEMVRRTVSMANEWEAAVIGVRVKSTIKVCDDAQVIVATPPRENLWEVQTPQIIRFHLLKNGFEEAFSKNFSVTDDASLVEILGKPVKVVEGSYTNIKVTTPDDFIAAEHYLGLYQPLMGKFQPETGICTVTN